MTAVLAYHKVDNRFELGVTNVRPKSFEKQVSTILAQGYRITVGLEPPGFGKSVCLTFDDGYECFYRNVVPTLSAFGVKAMVFVISDFVGRNNSWDIRLSYKPFMHMAAEQIREVARLGFEVGSHSCTHRDMTRLDRKELKNELADSKTFIEDLIGNEVDAFSFPFGRYNMITAEAAFAAGYRRLFGLGSASHEGVIARVPVYSIDSTAALMRKLDMNRFEILKSDIIHSFSNVSALLSVKNSRNRRLKTENRLN